MSGCFVHPPPNFFASAKSCAVEILLLANSGIKSRLYSSEITATI
ncbi:hypothetical protein [Bacillus thuringiensis]|nr:hypothetical protein [Bacillus thuringiensis]